MRAFYQPGHRPVPDYELIQPLGRGNIGQVWKASGPGGVPIALKIINTDYSIDGRKELAALKLLRNVRHPFLIPLHGVWLIDGDGHMLGESHESGTGKVEPAQLIIAMGLGESTLEGRLHECLKSGAGGIPPAELITYMQDAADAIDHLNQKCNIIHRDIKPQNILIVGGRAQVCDFGLAKALDSMQSRAARQTAFGTPAYSAPEVEVGEEPTSTTDQYSLAMAFYELRTGSLPFREEDVSSPLSRVKAKKQGRLDFSLVTEGERQVLLKATSPKPTDRYADCRKFVRRLRLCFEGLDSSMSYPKPPPVIVTPPIAPPIQARPVVEPSTKGPPKPPPAPQPGSVDATTTGKPAPSSLASPPPRSPTQPARDVPKPPPPPPAFQTIAISNQRPSLPIPQADPQPGHGSRPNQAGSVRPSVKPSAPSLPPSIRPGLAPSKSKAARSDPPSSPESDASPTDVQPVAANVAAPAVPSSPDSQPQEPAARRLSERWKEQSASTSVAPDTSFASAKMIPQGAASIEARDARSKARQNEPVSTKARGPRQRGASRSWTGDRRTGAKSQSSMTKVGLVAIALALLAAFLLIAYWIVDQQMRQ